MKQFQMLQTKSLEHRCVLRPLGVRGPAPLNCGDSQFISVCSISKECLSLSPAVSYMCVCVCVCVCVCAGACTNVRVYVSGNACYYSVQKHLSYKRLSINLNIKIYRTIILPVVVNGCETWSLTLRVECRMRVFENRVLRRIFEPKRDTVTGEWRKLNNEELNDLHCLPNNVQVIKLRRIKWVGHVTHMGRGEAHTGFRWGNLRERDHLEEPGIDGRIILRWIFMKWAGRHCSKLVHKGSTVTSNSTHIARAMNIKTKRKKKGKYFPPMPSVLTRK